MRTPERFLGPPRGLVRGLVLGLLTRGLVDIRMFGNGTLLGLFLGLLFGLFLGELLAAVGIIILLECCISVVDSGAAKRSVVPKFVQPTVIGNAIVNTCATLKTHEQQ